MHLSYYFLNFLSAELRVRLQGYKLSEGYLQNHHECVLGFHNDVEEFFIKFNLYQAFTSLAFPAEFSKSKKGTYNVFKELNGLKVLDIVQHENDRSFHIVFEQEYSLLFKLYGSRSNLVLCYQNTCIDIVNKNLALDRSITLTNVHKRVVQTFENFVAEEGDLRKVFPAFDKKILEELDLKNYSSKELKAKWDTIQEVLKIVTTKKFYLVEKQEEIQVSFFAHGSVLAQSHSAIEISNLYDRYFGQAFYFRNEKQEVLNYLQQKKKKHNAYLTVIEQKLKELKEQTRYDELANILMANLHQIPRNIDVVELYNFYTDKPIKIKIKGALTPQKNAENYYRKSKNQKLELAELEKNSTTKHAELTTYQEQLDFIEHCEALKDLRKYKKEHNLLEEKVKKEKVEESLFRRFEIEGYEIIVGKNAKNNDLLTQKYSFKEDLWLHARDVTGSHVLIKYKAGKKFPKSVIEKAAQLAAYYSKRKTDSLCPVIVTPKKYVRKPKGALDGQVVIEREEVVLVKPAGYDALEL